MPSGQCVAAASAGVCVVWMIAMFGCAGPQPLARAIDPKDEQAYAALLADHTQTPAQAFLADKSRSLGISLDEASRRDAALSSSSNPFDARRDQAAVSRGAVIYSHECMECHGEHADGRGPSLPMPVDSLNFHRTALRWDITMRGGAVKKWFKTIQDGATVQATRPDGAPVTLQMPAFSQRLTREQTWLVITYLQSMDRDLPPETAR